MNEPDYQDLKINKPIEPSSSTQVDSIMPGFNTVLQINHTVRRLIFDYALIAAILGLFRFNNDVGSILNFLTLLLLNLVMAIHIRLLFFSISSKVCRSILLALRYS